MSLQEILHSWRERVDQSLEHWLPGEQTLPFDLHRAMRYAVFNGGKRVRPVLVYAGGQAVDAPMESLDGPACAVELIHAYSLVHDDLPAMDNDDLRRGQPTCHKVFGDAMAILAGDAMQALAFHILVHAPGPDPERRIDMVDALSHAAGSRGMAGGQAIDMSAVGKRLTVAELENMHIHKTGALIRASVRLGALCASELDDDKLRQLDHYAKCIGLAFQIQDDILDEEGDTATLGKTQGADRERNKPTYPSLLGIEGSKNLAGELLDDALQSLDGFGDAATPLRDIARYIVERTH